jgi:NTE family protein
MKADWVLEGGGVKIPALVGAVAAAQEHGFEPSHLAGTSAGAIVAAGLAAGYSPSELKDIIFDVDFKKFRDGGRFLFQRAWNLLRTNGMYRGDYFEGFMRDLLRSKGVKYFGEVLSADPLDWENPKYRWRLKVIAADVTAGRIVKLPDDAIRYNLHPDEIEISRAVRMSMSIPFYFRPVEWAGNIIVDGGLLSNFPIWLFDSVGEPQWPTFGVLLKEENYNKANDTNGPVDFFKALVQTMMKAHDRRFVTPEDFTHRTIAAPTGDTETTNFDLTQLQKEWLYYSGHQAAHTFFEGWTWEKYKSFVRRTRGLEE